MISLIAQALGFVLGIMEFAIFISVLMSWIPQARGSKFDNFLRLFTEPILAPIRVLLARMMGDRNMMFDFSPVVAILIIMLLRNIIASFV